MSGPDFDSLLLFKASSLDPLNTEDLGDLSSLLFSEHMSAGNSLLGPALDAVPSSQSLMLQDTSTPSDFLLSPNSTSQATLEPPISASDVFGFSNFENVFISSEELAKAEEKLPHENHSPEDKVEDFLSSLSKWKITEVEESQKDACEAYFCLQFIEIGKGILRIKDQGLLWQGALFDASKSGFLWFWSDVSDLRVKHDPDSSEQLILFTLADSIFIQLKLFNTSKTVEVFEKMRSKHNQHKKSTLESRLEIEELSTVDDSDRSLEECAEKYEKLKARIEKERDAEVARIVDEANQKLRKLETLHIEEKSKLRINKALQESTKVSDCQICYDESVAVVLKPCGHQVCQTCLTRLERPQEKLNCPWDRNPISQVILLKDLEKF